MSIPSVSNSNILKVMGALDAYAQAPHAKVRAALSHLDAFDPTERWLLSFTHLLLMGKNFPGLLFSPYYPIPACAEQISSFADFLALLDFYKTKRVTPRNERRLIEFLRGCTREIRDYYEILMTKPRDAVNMVSRKEIRGCLDRVWAEDIYGNREESWNGLVFPLLISTAPSGLPLGMIYRVGQRVQSALFIPKPRSASMYTKESLPKWLDQDSKTIHTGDFLLLGLVDAEGKRFYPVDYFDSIKEYTRYRKDNAKYLPYRERVRKLEHFLSVNYLRQIQKLPLRCCENMAQVANAVAAVLQGSPHTDVLLCDSKGKLLQTATTEISGIIGGYWRGENGEALGVTVWHMGRELRCSFSFEGEEHALLYNPQLITGKYARVLLFDQGGETVGAVQEIEFERKPFKLLPHTFPDGAEGYIECCAFSTNPRGPYSHNGISDSSLKNFAYMLNTYGPDVWIKPSLYMRRRREKHQWSPRLLNRLEVVFRGYYVVANEAGEAMFKSDEKALQIYQERLQVPEFTRKKK